MHELIAVIKMYVMLPTSVVAAIVPSCLCALLTCMLDLKSFYCLYLLQMVVRKLYNYVDSMVIIYNV